MTIIRCGRRLLCAILLAGSAAPASSENVYRSADAAMAGETVMLTGNDLTVDQVDAVARHGAKVRIAPAARARMADTFGLMMQAATEGVPVYLFNRAPGSGRQIATFEGDPLSAANRPVLEAKVLAQFRGGASAGTGSEIDDAALVRAAIVVRANTMTYLAASPQLLDGLVGLLNAGVTPVVRSIGGTGEADGPMIGNVNGVLVGRGEAWLGGRRMNAAEALATAGLSRSRRRRATGRSAPPMPIMPGRRRCSSPRRGVFWIGPTSPMRWT